MAASLIKHVLSALVKPLAVAGAAYAARYIPGVDPSTIEATLTAVIAGAVTMLAEQSAKLKKAKAEANK